jgi:hypothetical protein
MGKWLFVGALVLMGAIINVFVAPRRHDGHLGGRHRHLQRLHAV